MRQDLVGSLACLQRAVRKDPSAERVWDNAAVLLGSSDQFPELVRLCEERVRLNDTVKSRVLLAKAYERAGTVDKAEGELDAALKKDPKHPAANLAMAMVRLKKSASPESLAVAEAHIKAAEAATNFDAVHQVNLAYVRGIYFGLSGKIAPAKDYLKKVLEFDNNDPAVLRALEILEQ